MSNIVHEIFLLHRRKSIVSILKGYTETEANKYINWTHELFINDLPLTYPLTNIKN